MQPKKTRAAMKAASFLSASALALSALTTAAMAQEGGNVIVGDYTNGGGGSLRGVTESVDGVVTAQSSVAREGDELDSAPFQHLNYVALNAGGDVVQWHKPEGLGIGGGGADGKMINDGETLSISLKDTSTFFWAQSAQIELGSRTNMTRSPGAGFEIAAFLDGAPVASQIYTSGVRGELIDFVPGVNFDEIRVTPQERNRLTVRDVEFVTAPEETLIFKSDFDAEGYLVIDQSNYGTGKFRFGEDLTNDARRFAIYVNVTNQRDITIDGDGKTMDGKCTFEELNDNNIILVKSARNAFLDNFTINGSGSNAIRIGDGVQGGLVSGITYDSIQPTDPALGSNGCRPGGSGGGGIEIGRATAVDFDLRSGDDAIKFSEPGATFENGEVRMRGNGSAVQFGYNARMDGDVHIVRDVLVKGFTSKTWGNLNQTNNAPNFAIVGGNIANTVSGIDVDIDAERCANFRHAVKVVALPGGITSDMNININCTVNGIANLNVNGRTFNPIVLVVKPGAVLGGDINITGVGEKSATQIGNFVEIVNEGILDVMINGRLFTDSFPVPPTTIDGTNGPDNLVGTPGPDTINGLGGGDTIDGLGDADTINGGAGADNIVGGAGPDSLFGQGAADVITGGAGDDLIDGGLQGTNGDVAIYQFNRADYTITEAGGIFTVVANVGDEGTETVTQIEVFRFADGDVDAATLP